MTTWIRPSTHPAKLYWAWRYLGTWEFLVTIVAKPIDLLMASALPELWYENVPEQLFDSRWGVDTFERLQLAEIDDLSDEQRETMHGYRPARAIDFGHVMSTLGSDPAHYAFIDIGSGKGRALILAAWFPFREIVGVELSEGLHLAAVENLKVYDGPRRCEAIASAHGDALSHPLPDGPFVCFMFNPFPAEVLSRFLDRLVDDVDRDPRHVVLIYGNAEDGHMEVLRSHPSLVTRADDDDQHYVIFDLRPELRPDRALDAPRLAATPMDVEVVHPSDLDADHLALYGEWHGGPWSPTPFVHHEYVLAAGEFIDSTKVAIIRRKGEPVGFFPFQQEGRAALPPGTILSDGDGIIIRPGINLDCIALLRACDLTSFTYSHMPIEPSPFTPFHHDVNPSARVDVSLGFDAYAAVLRDRGSKILNQSRRKARKLAREHGELRFELRVDHDAHADQLITWKQRQIEAADGDHRYTRSAGAFIRRLGAVPGTPSFESVLSGLYAGDRLVALYWSLRAAGLWVASVPTHDLAFASHSPGLLIHTALVEAVAEIDGVDEIDLGLAINPLKSRLMTHSVPFAQGTVYTSAAMRTYRTARTHARMLIHGV